MSTGRTCQHCGRKSPLISEALGLCVDCVRKDFTKLQPLIEKAHRRSRERFSLPTKPPKAERGRNCRLCANECRLAPGERSYCGLRINRENKLVGANAETGNVSWYYDALPTNCVADWVCPGGSGSGYYSPHSATGQPDELPAKPSLHECLGANKKGYLPHHFW